MGETPTIRGIKSVGPSRMPQPDRPISYEPPGLGRLRKVAIIGTAGTYGFAPFHDPSWEIWAHSSAIPICPRADRIFDLHAKHVWQAKKPWHKDYQKFLRTCPVPIYMQERFREIPQAVRYPRERVLSEFRRYFTSQTAWMVALALTEGVTHLGFYGIHYAHEDERGWQLACAEYWVGLAEGRGVQICVPPGSPLLHNKLLYGYESHDANGKNVMVVRHGESKKFDPSKLTMIDMANPAGRPPLMKFPDGEEPDWAHSGHEHHF